MKLKILALILLIAVLAGTASALDETSLWTKWGRTSAGINSMSSSEGYYASSNFTSYDYTSYGTAYQPLIGSLELTDNTTSYTAIQSSAYLITIDSSASLKGQLLISLMGQPSLLTTSDINNDGYETGESYFVGHDNSTIYIIGMSNSTLSIQQTINYTALGYNITFQNNGIKCVYYPFDSSERCFIQFREYSNDTLITPINGGLLTLIYPDGSNESTSVLTSFSDLNFSLTTVPNIADIDNDNILDVILWSDYNQDGTYGYSVYSAGITRSFYKDGLFDLSASGLTIVLSSNSIHNPVMYDFFTGGYKEIFLTIASKAKSWSVGGHTGTSNIYCYDLSGNECSGFPKTISTRYLGVAPNSDTFYTSNTAFGEINGENVVCGLGSFTSGATGSLAYGNNAACFSESGIRYNFSIPNSSSVVIGIQFVTLADFDMDNDDDLISKFNSSHLFINSNDGSNIYNTTALASSIYSIPVDIDGDSFLDIIQSSSTAVKFLRSSSDNELPDLTGDFGRDYANPICTGYSVRFTAVENTNYDQPIDEGYDDERLAADCQGNGTITYGAYAETQPYIDCNYPSAGGYYAKVYLQDEFHAADYSQYRNVLVQVISGVYGATCSIAGTSTDPGNESAASASAAAAEAGFTTMFSTILGDSLEVIKLKMLIGLGLLGMIIITAVNKGVTNPFALGMLAITGIVVLSLMSFFPVWVMILLIFAMVLMLLLARFIMKDSTGGL